MPLPLPTLITYKSMRMWIDHIHISGKRLHWKLGKHKTNNVEECQSELFCRTELYSRLPVHVPDRCFARKLNSGASKCPLERHNISRWSYLSDLQQCVLFSECHNPDAPVSSAWGNNFESKELCEATCMPKGLKGAKTFLHPPLFTFHIYKAVFCRLNN